MAMGTVSRLVIEVDGDARRFEKTIKKVEQSSDRFAKNTNKSFRGAAAGISAIDGPLGGVASRISSVNSLLSSGAVLWTGIGAAVAGSAFAVFQSIKAFDRYERQQLKVQQLVRTTGNAAGISAGQLAQQADRVALNTLASVEGIQKAQQVLLTFRGVQGETFNEAIRLSQDMAAVFGGSASDKALQLGKALESPTSGLNALKRSGVSFTESEKELIRTLEDTGQIAEAQGLILEKLAAQVGGAGSAEAGGVAGAVDTLGQRWDELLRAFAETTGSSSIASDGILDIAGALESVRSVIKPTVDELETELTRLEALMDVEPASGRRGQRARAQKGAATERAVEVRKELLALKAEQGDIEALNEVLAQTDDRIAGLQEKLDRPSGGRNGRARERSRQRELEALQAQRQATIDQLNQVESDHWQHLATQAQISKERDQQLEKEAAKAAAKANEKLEREQEANGRIINLARERYDRLHLDRLAAEQKDTELENARYQRLILSIERDKTLMLDAGAAASEVESLTHTAREEAYQAHLAKLQQIKDAADEAESNKLDAESRRLDRLDQLRQRDTEKALAAEEEKTEGLIRFVERLNRSRTDGENRYAAVALTLAKGLTDKKIQLRLKEATADSKGAIVKAWNSAPFPANIPAVALTTAKTALDVASIAGIAHGGLQNVPKESTYMLDKGERVLSPNQNSDLTKFLSSQSVSSGAPRDVQVVINNNGQPLSVSRAEFDPEQMKITVDLAEQKIADGILRGNGLVATAIESVYPVDRGVRARR